MRLRILYDNTAERGLMSGWGFSALVNENTLFDLGENAASLLANMHAMGVQPSQIEHVILSHSDWDHVGGLSVLKLCGELTVFVPEGFPYGMLKDIRELNAKAVIREVEERCRVDAVACVTRKQGSDKQEISLSVSTDSGTVLLAGCAHPGLDVIMRAEEVHGALHAVAGGFHGFEQFEALQDVPHIVACHCTKNKAEIARLYPDRTRIGYAGMDIALG